MSSTSVAFLLLILVQYFDACKSAKEKTVVGTLDSDVSLDCLASDYPDNDVDWEYAKTSADGLSDRVYQTGTLSSAFKERFQTNFTKPGLHSLKIRRVQYNDSGYYICTENSGQSIYKHVIYLRVADVGESSTKNPNPESADNGYMTTTVVAVGAPVIIIIIIIVVVIVLVNVCKRKSKGVSTSNTGNSSGLNSDNVALSVPIPCSASDIGSDTIPMSPQPTHDDNDHRGSPTCHDVIVTGLTEDDIDSVDIDFDLSTVKKIQKLRKHLEYFLEFHGLLAKMESLLSPDQQINLVRMRTAYEQNCRLLDHVSDMAEKDCQHFLKALEQSGQKHIANYIRCNGKFTTESDRDRPLDKDMLASLLVHIINDDNDITDLTNIVTELGNCGCITEHQKYYIEQADNDLRQKHNRLVEVLTRRSVADFKQFIGLLRRQNKALADLLEGKRTGNNCGDQMDCTDGCEHRPEEDDIFVKLRSRFPRINDCQTSISSDVSVVIPFIP